MSPLQGGIQDPPKKTGLVTEMAFGEELKRRGRGGEKINFPGQKSVLYKETCSPQ